MAMPALPELPEGGKTRMKRSTKCILKSIIVQGGIALILVICMIVLAEAINWGAEQTSNAIQADVISSTPVLGTLSLIAILTIGGIGLYYGTIKPCLIEEKEHKKED